MGLNDPWRDELERMDWRVSQIRDNVVDSLTSFRDKIPNKQDVTVSLVIGGIGMAVALGALAGLISLGIHYDSQDRRIRVLEDRAALQGAQEQRQGAGQSSH